MVPIDQCDLLEKNAPFMRAEQYQRLVSNVKRDGCLTSVPFAVRNGERFLILSGNHRVQAAKRCRLDRNPRALLRQGAFPGPAAGDPAFAQRHRRPAASHKRVGAEIPRGILTGVPTMPETKKADTAKHPKV